MHNSYDKCIQNTGQEIWKEEALWEDLGKVGR
jgi:hypothetical protein